MFCNDPLKHQSLQHKGTQWIYSLTAKKKQIHRLCNASEHLATVKISPNNHFDQLFPQKRSIYCTSTLTMQPGLKTISAITGRGEKSEHTCLLKGKLWVYFRTRKLD